jgi:hypothetical protein
MIVQRHFSTARTWRGTFSHLKLLTLRIDTNKAKTEGSFVEEKKGMKKVNFTISSSEKLASLDFLSLDKKTLANLL